MSIDLMKETRLSLESAAREFVYRPNERTLRRWITKGFKGVKLEGIREGQCWTTTREAVLRFLAELQRRQLDG